MENVRISGEIVKTYHNDDDSVDSIESFDSSGRYSI